MSRFWLGAASGLFLVAAGLAYIFIGHYPVLRPTIKHAVNQYRYSYSESEQNALQRLVAAVRADDNLSAMEIVDEARNLIYTNSVHGKETESDLNPWDTPQVVSRIAATLEMGGDPPLLTCGPRALAMQAVLLEIGIESRFVQLFTSGYDHIRSHSVLDVYNPEQFRWELHDPDYNVSYVDRRTGDGVSTSDLILGNLEELVPRKSSSETGWGTLRLDFLREYFASGLYDNLHNWEGGEDLVRKSMLVNDLRFEMTKVYSRGLGDFRQYVRKNHGDPVFIHVLGEPYPKNVKLGAIPRP